MNIARIIEWILLELSNEYEVYLSNFATSLSNILKKITHISDHQTQTHDIEYWHTSATIVHGPKGQQKIVQTLTS